MWCLRRVFCLDRFVCVVGWGDDSCYRSFGVRMQCRVKCFVFKISVNTHKLIYSMIGCGFDLKYSIWSIFSLQCFLGLNLKRLSSMVQSVHSFVWTARKLSATCWPLFILPWCLLFFSFVNDLKVIWIFFGISLLY